MDIEEKIIIYSSGMLILSDVQILSHTQLKQCELYHKEFISLSLSHTLLSITKASVLDYFYDNVTNTSFDMAHFVVKKKNYLTKLIPHTRG